MKYSKRTEIRAENAKGKTTLKDAAAWILYGSDAQGTKDDVQPTTYDADFTSAAINMEIDGQPLLLERSIVSGKNKFSVDGVPSTATEFNERVAGIVHKDVFLTLYNPEYFFLLHKDVQRDILLSFVLPPANAAVFKEMPEKQSKLLKDAFKKNDVDQLTRIHRDNKLRKEKEYLGLQSRTKTLKEQADQIGALIPVESLHTEMAQYKKEIDALNANFAESLNSQKAADVLNNKINVLTDRIEDGRIRHSKAKNRHIETDCYTCGQLLTEAARKASEDAKDKGVANIAADINPLILQRDELREQLKEISFEPVPEDSQERQAELYKKISDAEQELRKNELSERLENDLAESNKIEADTRDDLNLSIVTLDYLKAYTAKRAEMQATKIQNLFTTLSIKLFDTLKGSGEQKPTFEITMDGKEYKRLSLSEKIKAGLELRAVISEQGDIVTPVFVDNAESITVIDAPDHGQLITATVVKGSDLVIRQIEEMGNNNDEKQ